MVYGLRYSGFQPEELGSSPRWDIFFVFLYGFNSLNLDDFFICNDIFLNLTSILDSKEVIYNINVLNVSRLEKEANNPYFFIYYF